MELLFFCPRWGAEDSRWEDWLPRVKAAGYDGIEWAVAADTEAAELDKVFRMTGNLKLRVILQHYDTGDPVFSRHLDHYAAWFEKIKFYPALKINTQTGKDHFSMAENTTLIGLANAFGAAQKIPVVHETHRGKFSFAVHVMRAYLEAMPELRITLDASHWCAVAESWLDDQPEALQMAVERTDHIHARVGYPEGPQVSDPRAAEWLEGLNKHLAWWDAVITIKRQKNEMLTITPEFGPFPYMVRVPRTGEPIANQWEVNLYMMKLLRERYNL